jgi:hypothetical protein
VSDQRHDRNAKLGDRNGDTPSPSFSIEHGHGEYSDAELLEQAQGNAQALILGTMRFLKERGTATAEWTAFLGELFGEGWGQVRPWDAGEFLDAALTNLRSLGASVKTVELGIERAQATIVGFPDPDLAESLGVTLDQASVYLEVVGAIAAPRGLGLTWETERGGVLRLLVERGSARG